MFLLSFLNTGNQDEMGPERNQAAGVGMGEEKTSHMHKAMWSLY